MDLISTIEVARFFLVDQAPLFAGAAVIYAIVALIKRMSPPASRSPFWRRARRILPHLPVLVGALLGHHFGSWSLGALSGFIATHGYHGYKIWRKYDPPKE